MSIGRGVVEAVPGRAQQERFRIQAGLGALVQLGQHFGLGRRKHAVQTPQHGERQDDLAVFRLLVVTAQQVGNRPDKGGQGLLIHQAPRYTLLFILAASPAVHARG